MGILRQMATASIDAVVTDPPYQVELNEKTCPWDRWPGQETWQEIGRVLKPEGVLAFTIAPHVTHERVPDVTAVGFKVLETGFWIWGNGRPLNPHRLKRSYDLVYFCSQAGKKLFTDQARGEYPAGTSTGKRAGGVKANVACQSECEAFGETGYELIFSVKRLNGRGRVARGTHPTEKPVDLVAQIVKLCARPGDVVLDPFMGSGTTGEAEQALGCSFVGIERDGGYFDLAKRRIE